MSEHQEVDQKPGGGPRDRRRLSRTKAGRVHVRVYLTENQAEELSRRAAAAGVTKSRFLAESALTDDRRTVGVRRSLYGDFKNARRIIAGAAGLLNQLTTVANATGQISGDVPALAAELTEIAAGLGKNADALMDTVLGSW